MRPYLILVLFCRLLTFAEANLNVVFILGDDMNRDSWGTYGNKDCKTPHIDRLANGGVRFERAYCSVAMCAPFRQELYSGRSPWRTGTLPNHSKSVPGTKSIAHYLKPLGYEVALLGKSHIGPKECYPFKGLGDVSKAVDANPELLKRSKKFFDNCEKKGQPFCLFIASHDSHAPFTTGDPTAYDAQKISVPPYWIDTPELRQEMVKYYAEVTNFDRLVGMIRTELEKRKLWENTIFIVCSEQGTQLPFAKWTCYDNGLRTGLVMHWPGLSRAGSIVEPLVSIQDIVPSLILFLGGELFPGDCDGKSFLSLLKEGSEPIHSYLYGAFTNCRINDNRERIFPIRSIRDERYSLIYNPNFKSGITSNITLSKALRMVEDDNFRPSNQGLAGSWVDRRDRDDRFSALVHKLHHRTEYELYDLEEDPHELFNLAEKNAYQSMFKKLKRTLEKKLHSLGDSDPIVTERSYLSQSR